MNGKYKVTVSIALYNCENYIERCVNSVLAQTYDNIEVVIVNDGSTDNSLDVVKKIKQNYQGNKEVKIYTKDNGGLSSARNFGIEKSTGKFIMMIDADDWLEKNTIEEMVRIQCKNNCDIVRINYFINATENKIINKGKCYKYQNELIDIQNNKENIISDILLGNIPAYTWAMLINKETIKETLYFEKNVHLEDKIFLIKLISNIKNIYFSSYCLYHYFFNINGLMHKHSYEYYLEKDFAMNNRINQIINEYYNNYINLHTINNTMSSYSIERNLFNIYKKNNKQKMLEEYHKIKENWEKICEDVNYEYLKKSMYAKKGDYYLKKWKDGNISDIIRSYNINIKKDKIKQCIKKLIGK